MEKQKYRLREIIFFLKQVFNDKKCKNNFVLKNLDIKIFVEKL